MVNDKVRRYEGYDYEKVMLTTQMALNLLAGERLRRRAHAIKKTHEREAMIADLRDKEYLRAEEQAEERRRQDRSTRTLQGYPVASLDAPEVVSLKNSYQSAFSHYLAGFVYEVLGEKDLAAPGYRKAAELRPNTPLLEQALAQPRQAKWKDEDSRHPDRRAKRPGAGARFDPRAHCRWPIKAATCDHPLSFPIIKPDTSTATARPRSAWTVSNST